MYQRFLLAVVLAGSAAWAGETAVWEIGTRDASYEEFAVARDYPSYRARFGAKPPVFEVGKSQAKRDWPFIHPGPADVWAGSRTHAFRIRFPLAEEPRGTWRLRVDFCDVHSSQPPAYTVAIGSRSGRFPLKKGAGDESLTNPKAGKPQHIEVRFAAGLLRKGTNEIVLSCADGSWVQYDSVALFNDATAKTAAAAVQSVTVRSTPFFIRKAGKVLRAVEVHVGLSGPAGKMSLRVEAGGETVDVPMVDLPFFGAVSQEVGVPDSAEPMKVTVTATVDGRSKSATATVAPQRKWRIFVAPSAHTDIGYTDIQPKCAERHNENLDVAMELLTRYPDFRWNCEVAWQAENYLAARKGEQLAAFLRHAREGRVGVQALYCNILTGLCSHEEACRLLYTAHAVHRRHGVPFESAMISDVPSQEASIPMILANAGIRYFSSGINNTRGPFNQMYGKCPCWWEGPDGSRVLMMFVPGYSHAQRWGLQSGLEQARARILGALRGYEARKDYPYDAVFLHGAVSDNCALDRRLATVAKAWNDRYEFPKVILSHNAEFFRYVEEKYGKSLPVFRGSSGTYWEDGAGSSARETALCRNAHEAVGNAEKLLAIARRLKPALAYPKAALYAAWRNCLLYDEHTWGAHCSISQPESEFTRAQWRIKAQFAKDAAKQSAALYGQGVKALAALVTSDAPGILVVNPTSWPRTDVVALRLPRGKKLADTSIPTCEQRGTTMACVRDVPANGYRVLELADRGKTPAPTATVEEGTAIESRYYRVAFHPETGAITSLVDKELGRELVDAKAPFALNQYLYVAGGEGTRIVHRGGEPKLTVTTTQKAYLRRQRLGKLGETMTIATSGTRALRFAIRVSVWNDVKRVDIANRFEKSLTYAKEAVYFAFPFAAHKPTFRYEIPAGVVTANSGMLPGACLDWFTVQHFVEVADAKGAIAWATPDAPLACFQDINRGKWQTRLDFANGHVYAYVMNNYWFTNYLAGQEGENAFRFAITSRAKGDAAASAQFGWAVSNPLVATAIGANKAGVLPGDSASLVEIAEPNVVLVGAKQAEESNALVLRLWEASGKATTAHVRVPLLKASKATACNLVEEPAEPLEVRGGTIAVPIRASGLATVMVE